MRIWIDADACPVQIREIVVRAAVRRSVPVVFVANKPFYLPKSELIEFVQVLEGPDVADAYIVEHAKEGELAVTQDIGLAALLVPLGVIVISPRGDSYNEDNIGDVLARRNLMQELRDTGEISGGPRPFDDKLKRQFASLFDAALHKLLKK
jgi:hypothetical protein